MRSKKYCLDKSDKKAKKQMKDMVQMACRLLSSVTVETECKRFNVKSILKIGELKKGEEFYLIIEGTDEQESMAAFDELFEER